MPELDRDLRQLGALIAYPAEPDLVPGVLVRLHEPRRPFYRRRAVLALTAAVVVAVAVAFAVPPARTAILRFFHIGGERVERVNVLPPASRRSPVAGLDGPLTLGEATRRAGFRVLLPPRETAVHGRFYGGDSIVATLLRVPGTSAPILLAEFRGDLGIVKKLATPGTEIEPTRVGDADALWIHGAPHVLVYRDSTGRGRSRVVRLAGNALVWTRGGVTLRLEGPLSEGQALHIAALVG